MSSIFQGYIHLVLIVSMLSLTGCSRTDQPELGEVTGTITLDGMPLSGIAVVFQPENGRPARGKTDTSGKYELTYIRDTKGAKVGTNRVEIAPSEEGEDELVETFDDLPASTPKPSKVGKPKIPARYNLQSELTREVKPGTNIFDFNLDS